MHHARVLPLLGGLVVMPAFMVFVVTGEGGAYRGVVSVLILAGVVATLAAFVNSRRQRGRGSDLGWTPVPAIDPSRLQPATEPARGSVTWALAPVESALLATNTWFAVGVGFCLMFVGLFGPAFPEEMEPTWLGTFAFAPMLVHPLVGCVVVAAHRGVTRSRRDGTDELFTSCPATWSARTRAHLATLWVPLLAGSVFLAIFLACANAGSLAMAGPIDRREAVDLAVALVLLAGGVALGVALGRWAPWTLVPFVAVVLVLVASSRILTIGGTGVWVTDDWLSTYLPASSPDMLFVDPPGWARVAWFASLTIAVAAIALLKGHHSHRVPITLAGALAVAGLAAWTVSQPVTATQAQATADLIDHASDHQTCTQVAVSASVCVYDAYRQHASPFVEALEPVAAALPPGVPAEPAVFREFLDADFTGLQPEVADALDAGGTRFDDLHLPFYAHPENYNAIRMRLAAYAVGLPTEPVSAPLPTVVAGEARGVVVLWLAARGLDANAARHLVAPNDEPGVVDTPQTQGDIWPARCYGEDAVLVWAPQDLRAARELLDLPEAAVHDVIVRDWDRWIDPATPTDDLLAAVGAEPVGAADQILPFAATCG